MLSRDRALLKSEHQTLYPDIGLMREASVVGFSQLFGGKIYLL